MKIIIPQKNSRLQLWFCVFNIWLQRSNQTCCTFDVMLVMFLLNLCWEWTTHDD